MYFKENSSYNRRRWEVLQLCKIFKNKRENKDKMIKEQEDQEILERPGKDNSEEIKELEGKLIFLKRNEVGIRRISRETPLAVFKWYNKRRGEYTSEG